MSGGWSAGYRCRPSAPTANPARPPRVQPWTVAGVTSPGGTGPSPAQRAASASSSAAGVAPEDSGAASGLLNVAQQVGASLGLGILTSVFAAASIHGSSHPAAGLDAKREAAQVLAHGVSAALTGSAVFLVISLVVALVMVGRRRTE